jgi:hypothetical protein
LGFEARELTPLMVQRVTITAAETRSFKRAKIVMKEVGGQEVSAKSLLVSVQFWLKTELTPISSTPISSPHGRDDRGAQDVRQIECTRRGRLQGDE